MNILWLSHLVPYPPRAGVAQRSYGLLNELCKRHSVTLLAFHQRALMGSMSHDPEEELDNAVQHLASICAGVEVFEIPCEATRFSRYALAFSSLFRKHPYTINWLKSKEFTEALLRKHSSNHDLVHFDTISLAIFRHCFGDLPCVMNHHNVESHLLYRRAQKTRSRIARFYYWQEAVKLESYEAQTANQFDLHVTCSELDRERLHTISPGLRCCVIPNGVDVSYFEQRMCVAPEPIFTFVGTLGWGPNSEAVGTICNKLWPAIAKEWPQAKMYLVGSHPPQYARELAARDERFVVTGFVDDVRPYMEKASFFLCPIKDGGGTKLKILNAMSMGKVVVADPIAYEGIDITPGSDAILASATEDYIRGVRSLLADHSQYDRVAAAARRLIATRYSYEAIGQDLDRQYSSIRESSACR